LQLLKPQQNKDLKSEQDLRNIIRTQEILKAEQEARLKLANAEADFNNTLAKNREKWALEEEYHEKRVREQKQEVDHLEAQRLNALIPIDNLKASAEEQLNDAEQYAKKLREKEEYNDDLTEKLQDKLDRVGQKDQDLKQKELELKIREEGIERQSQNTIIGTEKLNNELMAFSAYKEKEETILQQKRLLADRTEESLAIREAELIKKTKEVNDRAVRLADERGVLQRAWNELKRKS
jgi:hypothetical protein